MTEQTAQSATQQTTINLSLNGAQHQFDADNTPVAADKPSSYVVLEAEMLFFHKKGEELYNKLVDWLQRDAIMHNRSNANLITQVAKSLADYRSKAVDAAAKLAAYQLPKLTAVELKSEHRFVVHAPPPISNSDAWLDHVNREAALKVALNPPTTARLIANGDPEND